MAGVLTRALRAPLVLPASMRLGASSPRRHTSNGPPPESPKWSSIRSMWPWVWGLAGCTLLLGTLVTAHNRIPAEPSLVSVLQVYRPQERILDAVEMSKHKARKDGIWVAIDGIVYDVSKVLLDHPIGPKPILHHAGEDITTVFLKLHKPETLERLLASNAITRIGLVDPKSPPPAIPQAHRPSKPAAT